GPAKSPYLRWDTFELSDFVAPWARREENMAPVRERWTDEWGCEWATIDTTVGQVVAHPMASAQDYTDFPVPEPEIDAENLEANHREYPDKICTGGTGFFFFERLEKLRGFNNAMMDLVAEREVLDPFLDRVTQYFIEMVDQYARSGLIDCLCINEDLGLQDRLTISPDMWREVFKPRYKAVYDRAHEHGMLVFQHSCGYVQDIIADLAEIGVDILELQQMQCMDMETVARERGKMTITAPVDIQAVMPTNDWQRILDFQKRLFRVFDSQSGGYFPQMYSDMDSLKVSPQIVVRLQETILELCHWRDNPDLIR
ncbi:MAG: uroporphyrinogen decarboxylase family protein, partial [Candidatus Sumerlaeota bacterium]